MRIFELSELRLAALIAIATVVGGGLSAVVEAYWIDAGTERETDVQLVKLAIGILSEPVIKQDTEISLFPIIPIPVDVHVPKPTSQHALREWAVDTINEVAEVKFGDEAKKLLVNGEVGFFSGIAYSLSGSRQEWEEIAAEVSRTAGQERNIEEFEQRPQPAGEVDSP